MGHQVSSEAVSKSFHYPDKKRELTGSTQLDLFDKSVNRKVMKYVNKKKNQRRNVV